MSDTSWKRSKWNNHAQLGLRHNEFSSDRYQFGEFKNYFRPKSLISYS